MYAPNLIAGCQTVTCKCANGSICSTGLEGSQTGLEVYDNWGCYRCGPYNGVSHSSLVCGTITLIPGTKVAAVNLYRSQGPCFFVFNPSLGLGGLPIGCYRFKVKGVICGVINGTVLRLNKADNFQAGVYSAELDRPYEGNSVQSVNIYSVIYDSGSGNYINITPYIDVSLPPYA